MKKRTYVISGIALFALSYSAFELYSKRVNFTDAAEQNEARTREALDSSTRAPASRDPASAASPTQQEQELAWHNCVAQYRKTADLLILQHCMAELDTRNAPNAETLGNWMCTTSADVADIATITAEVLKSVAIEEVLSFIDALQLKCTKFKNKGAIRRSFWAIEQSNPGWTKEIGMTLTPDLMFNRLRGTAVVQIARVLAEVEGGEWARHLLEEGGQGNFGGTNEQIDRAGIASIVLQYNPDETLRYINAVMDSSNTPGGGGVGSSLMAFLLEPNGKCWPEGDSHQAIAYANQLLDDQRFAKEAAMQIFVEYSAASPPPAPKLDLDAWARLVARAELLIR